VTDWGARTTTYGYDDANRLTTISYPNGLITTNAYDDADRLESITVKQGTTTIASFAYTLDNVGNRLSMVDADGTTSYSYDELDRLTSVSYPTGIPASVTYTMIRWAIARRW